MTLLLLACFVHAEQGLIRLTVSPTLSVADGRSTVTVSAEVRDSSGRSVKDGTQVVFATTLGNFRDEVVPVIGGYARAILVAGSTPGIAKISASAITLNATTVQEFEFVANREMLSAAKEYVDIESPQVLRYNVDLRIIGAASENKGVILRYRDIEIKADDLQLNVPTFEVKAKKATLRIGKTTTDFDELYIRLNFRKGFGTTTYQASDHILIPFGQSVHIEQRQRSRFGLMTVRSTGISEPDSSVDAKLLSFDDISAATSCVQAKRAIAFPRKEIQFHHASILVGDATVMKVPLYSIGINSSALVTEQIVSVNDNQIAINYPYYLSLEPGFSSLLRFRTGESYGRGFTANRGAFLDYEMTWSHGENSEGGLTYNGIGRSDWGFGVHQSLRPDDRTNAYLQADISQGKSVFGALNVSRSYNGFNASLSGSSSHTITGLSYSNQQMAMNLEKNPTKVGSLPIRLYYGLTATAMESNSVGLNASQSGFGLRGRMQLLPQIIDSSTNFSATVTATSLTGRNTNGGLGVLATATLTRQLGQQASTILTYDFADDGYSSSLLGRHRLSTQLFYGSGPVSFAGVYQRSLDMDRSSIMLDGGYRLSGLWRMSCYYTIDRYLTQSFEDYNFVLGYRLGIRDIGLVFSGRTQKIGFQILGASFN
jgi:hypothetical protein